MKTSILKIEDYDIEKDMVKRPEPVVNTTDEVIPEPIKNETKPIKKLKTIKINKDGSKNETNVSKPAEKVDVVNKTKPV